MPHVSRGRAQRGRLRTRNVNGGSVFIGLCWSDLKSRPLKPLYYLYCLRASLFLQPLPDSKTLSVSFRCPKTPEFRGSSVFRPHRRASRLHPQNHLYLRYTCINLVFFFLSGSVKSQKNSTNTATTGTFGRCVFCRQLCGLLRRC